MQEFRRLKKKGSCFAKFSSLILKGVRIVPEKMVFTVERLGKYERTLEPGMHFLISFVDKIAYVRSLKEHAIHIPNQPAVTNDNVSILIDAAIFVQVFNPMLASYA
nr:stomatin-like protein 2, mitochondrial [Tanacetum cinerariifolium]